jgi:hypothetical protein
MTERGEVTVGRHAAADGVGIDPIVAAALSRRPEAPTGLPRHGQESRQQPIGAAGDDGGLGWPGDPADGTDLGWPVELITRPPDADDRPAVAVLTEQAPGPRRSAWRRLFGGGSDDRDSSAA